MAAPKGNKFAARNTGGRPTAYKPRYGDQLIALMAEGYSLLAAAGAMGFTRQTFHNWKRNYPDFANAMGVASASRVFYLESLLMSKEKPLLPFGYIKTQLINTAPEAWGKKAGQILERRQAEREIWQSLFEMMRNIKEGTF